VAISYGIAMLRESIPVFDERKDVFVVKKCGICCAKDVGVLILYG
jgi:hypothetical protein